MVRQGYPGLASHPQTPPSPAPSMRRASSSRSKSMVDSKVSIRPQRSHSYWYRIVRAPQLMHTHTGRTRPRRRCFKKGCGNLLTRSRVLTLLECGENCDRAEHATRNVDH